jgi:tetratricopeptide (TPR) repeat protein
MAIEGPLKELHIHDVFQLLDLGRKTVVLCVTSELRQNSGMVYFERGAVVAAEIRSNPHPLGTLLMRNGKISEADLARARDMQTLGDTRRLGDILVDVGAINRRELERLVRQQVQEVIFELMNWSEGYFSFEESAAPRLSAEATVRIQSESLLMEAARRIDEWSRIETRVPHLGVVPRLADADSQHGLLDLTPLEWEVVASVDGARDVRALAEAVGRPEFEVARTIFGLSSTGVIQLDDPARLLVALEAPDVTHLLARAEEHLALGDVESARLVASEAVTAFPDQAAAHGVLGRVLLAGRYLDTAEEAFLEALKREPDFAAARRLLGTALAASGRYEEAIATWQRWRQLPDRPPEELALQESVDRLQAAARLLSDAVRGWYD